MRSIALYGKGGSGKSTICSNLSYQLARCGKKVLQIGCDPKGDSTLSIMGGRSIPSFVSLMKDRRPSAMSPSDFVFKGEAGVDCIEAGGPEPGQGCAGRGIVSLFQKARSDELLAGYDVVLLDVLGDVVCGGFAAPLMHGVAGKVAIVVADTAMSMFAANNIARAIVRFERNGARLAGLIANDLRRPRGAEEMGAFAAELGTRLLCVIPRSEEISEADRECRVASERSGDGEAARRFSSLATLLHDLDSDSCPTPKPMDNESLAVFVRKLRG